VQYRRYAPHPSLAHIVRCFQTLDDVHTVPTSEHRVYPEVSIHLSFVHGTSWFSTDPNGGAIHRVPKVFVERSLRYPARLVSLGPTRMVSAEFYVWDAARLFGRLDNDATLGASLVGEDLAARMDRLLAEGELEEAVYVLEAWLIDYVAQFELRATPAVRVAKRLLAQCGQGSVSELADDASVSLRQLERIRTRMDELK